MKLSYLHIKYTNTNIEVRGVIRYHHTFMRPFEFALVLNYRNDAREKTNQKREKGN